ncbi:MAG: ferric reductase-like transmembrane domain-containing protein [Phycisphaerales bacterium]|nr:ferric reductase-like transmembrane domain-containing protein [Phycisphaerales bacterium]
MSVGYVAVQWNRHKRVYDACVIGGILLYVGVFFSVGKALFAPPHAISDEILAIRALGTCAFLLLHVILCIGPLARLNRRFLPLLYNRRHLGVATFCVALAHAALIIGYYHGFGVVNPFVSLLTSNTNYSSLAAFPFELLGLIALAIMFLMAATSHDFWLKLFGAPAWKRLHMLVYVAYALLVAHVALGILQTQRAPWLAALVGAGVVVVASLHIAAGLRETRFDATASPLDGDDGDWVDVADVGELRENSGHVAVLGAGRRVALFRVNGRVYATTNTCAHQGGPLGEGRVIDGCVTCPWHGWQYRAHDGQSPPPFSEKIPTYRARIVGSRVQINAKALPPGTPVEPAVISEHADG